MRQLIIPDHYRGDTFDGLLFTLSVNGVPLNLSNAIIKATFRQSTSFRINLTIVDALNGVCQIDEQIINWPAGTYKYDIEITINNRIKTYVFGTWTIIQDVTYG